MNKIEAAAILNKLECIYSKNPFTDEKLGMLAFEQYTSIFLDQDYIIAEKAINTIIRSGAKYFPLVGEILDALKAEKIKSFEASTDVCYICDGKGGLFYTEEGISYFAHCTCGHGKRYNYDGRKNTPPNKYYSVCVTEAFYQEELDEIKLHNMFRDRKIIPAPPELKQTIQRLVQSDNTKPHNEPQANKM